MTVRHKRRERPLKTGLVSLVVVAGADTEAALACAERVGEVGYAVPRGAGVEVVVVGSASDLETGIGARLAKAVGVVVASGTSIAAARNAGAAAASGEILVFVDRDATPEPGWLAALLEGFRVDANVAATAGLVLESDATVAYAGAGLTFAGEPLAPGRGKPLEAAGAQAGDVLFGSPWALAVETKAFRWIDGFDAEHTTGIEHVDLGWRLWLAGFSVRFAPDAVLRLAPRAEEAGGPFPTRSGLAMLYKNLEEGGRARALAGALALADAGTTPAFRDALPSLAKARERVQGVRRVRDSQIFRLFGAPLSAGSLDEEAVASVRSALDIDALFTDRHNVVIVTPDVLQSTMAGPAIRAWQMARALAREHDVRLVSTARCDLTHGDFPVSHAGEAELRGHVDWADVVVFQGHVLADNRWMGATDTILVADIYDPIHLEVLEQARDLTPNDRRHAVRDAVGVMNEQLLRGDYFLCASDKQRDFWLGQLAGVGRINPATYDDHENLQDLIDVVPFGISEEVPTATERVLRGVVPGIGDDDKVILWGGGVYNWFDPLTLVKAIDRLRQRVPEVRLYFMGMKHPNPNVPAMQMAFRTRRLADDLGLTGEVVFFNEDWIAYDQRHNYLLESDIGVSTHLDHVETAFSFRTRILDYLWTSLPIVATAGDSFADLIEHHGLGLTVAPGSVEELEDALFRLLTDDGLAASCRAAISEAAEQYRWSTVLEPVLEFCRNPRRAPDLVDPRQRVLSGDPAAGAMWGRRGLRHMALVALGHLRAGEYQDLRHKLRVRAREFLSPDR